MTAPAVGRLRFIKPVTFKPADTRTSVPENVVVRIRNMTTTTRTVRKPLT